MTPAAEVRAARRKLKMSQGQFALKLGLNLWSGRVAVSRWENGKVKPSAATLRFIRFLAKEWKA